jgi:iron complex transport system ATP-binding protein
MLHTDHITYTLNGRDLLRDVTLTLGAGDLIGLIGPNGAGKSTLLRIVAGLLKPTRGMVTVCGQPMHKFRPRDLARWIALVPQSAAFEAAFTAREVVLMGRNPYLSRWQVEGRRDREIVGEALIATDTAHLADRLITTLSGGERQRVFLARALAQQPDMLLLDEPTTHLDVRHQLDLLTLVRRLAKERNIGVLVALHELPLAARFCDDLILLHDGQIAATGAPEAVLSRENLATVFQIDAAPYRDPIHETLQFSVNLPEESIESETVWREKV